MQPEQHPLATQVAAIRSADVVAGIAGSNMFSMAFTQRPVPVVAVTSENYHAHNERQLAALRGHDLTLIRSEPSDVEQSSLPALMHAPTRVDVDEVQAQLRRAIHQ